MFLIFTSKLIFEFFINENKMRKKLNKEEKKVNFKLRINEDMNKMLEEYLKEKGVKKSKFIEELVSDYLKNKK